MPRAVYRLHKIKTAYQRSLNVNSAQDVPSLAKIPFLP